MGGPSENERTPWPLSAKRPAWGASRGRDLTVKSWVGGGVAANGPLRQQFEQAAAAKGYKLHVPPLSLCTDNAVMGAIAVERLRAGQFEDLDLDIYPGLQRIG